VSEDRRLAPFIRRINMMISRGALEGTADDGDIQTMQVALLADETADDVERIQTYGLSTNPPNGGDALVAFVGGNRDHGVVLAVNDRGSRPKGLKSGEVVLYNDQDVRVSLTTDGDLKIATRRHVEIEATEEITIKAKTMAIEVEEAVTIIAPDGVHIDGDLVVDGDIRATGSITGAP
jgi:phage baseplate assembly protein V